MLVLRAGAAALAGPELDERIGLGAGQDALAGPELDERIGLGAGQDALAGPELDRRRSDERIGLGAGQAALAGPELEAAGPTSGSVWVPVRPRSPARNSIAAGATSGSV